MNGQQPTQAAGLTPLESAQATAAEYRRILGPRGPELFINGYSFEDASMIVIAELNEEISRQEELKARLIEDSQEMIPAELSNGGSKRRQL